MDPATTNEMLASNANCDWDKLDEAAKVIANVQQAFDMSGGVNSNNSNENVNDNGDESAKLTTNGNGVHHSGVSNGSNVLAAATAAAAAAVAASANAASNLNAAVKSSKVGSMVPKSASIPPTDAQTIAILLQKQLEDIDNEIRSVFFFFNVIMFIKKRCNAHTLCKPISY